MTLKTDTQGDMTIAHPDSQSASVQKRSTSPSSAGDQCVSGTPIGDCAGDEPLNTLPAEPVSISKVVRPRKETSGVASAGSGSPSKEDVETPATHGEEDIPSDGKDPEGEAMIREVPARRGDGKQTGASPDGDRASAGQARAEKRTG